MSVFKKRKASDLQKQLGELQDKGFQNQDENEWKLTVDKDGNGTAIIRFLPSSDDEGIPFIKKYTHGFKHNGKWFIENCPTTIEQGDVCPVCTANKELWDGGEADKKLAGQRKRGLSFWSNILVVKDPANEENNGKVFKYRFGMKIMDKIKAMANPPEELGDEPVDVTCVYEGADFFLSAKLVSKQRNYDDSKFKTPSAIKNIDDEEFAQNLMDSMHDLKKLVAPEEFESYETLENKFNAVVGNTSGRSVGSAADDDLDGLLDGTDTESKDNDDEPKPKKGKAKSEPADTSDDDDLDDLLDGLDD